MSKLPNLLLFGLCLIMTACGSEVSREKRPFVNEVNNKVQHINANHRVQIVEDDFHEGDSIYKIRGYLMEGRLLKLVGILYTTGYEREDYFYFENQAPIFSGHVIVKKDERMASEYKYYYGTDGYVKEALFWEDHYEMGKRFPHEHFKEFMPDVDSLRKAEESRLQYLMSKLSMEGFEIRHLNENLDANTIR